VRACVRACVASARCRCARVHDGDDEILKMVIN